MLPYAYKHIKFPTNIGDDILGRILSRTKDQIVHLFHFFAGTLFFLLFHIKEWEFMNWHSIEIPHLPVLERFLLQIRMNSLQIWRQRHPIVFISYSYTYIELMYCYVPLEQKILKFSILMDKCLLHSLSDVCTSAKLNWTSVLHQRMAVKFSRD